MSTLDWLIVALYALVMIGIGYAASRKQANTDEYFRGARQIPWWAIGISIMATSFSAASLLGGPAQGYDKGFLWLQMQIGDLVGYTLVILLFLPLFVKLNITTAYEYLEKRFDAKNRSLASFCFLLFILARLGGLLYGAALVVSIVTNLPLNVAIVIVGIASIAYTVAGGIAAVVWTDVLQFALIFVGLGAGVWAASSGVEGGFGELWSTAAAAGKLQVINLSWEPTNLVSLPTAVIPYGILAFAVAGTNQQSVQRYVSCADVQSGRKAALLGWFTGLIGVAITLLLGILMYSFYTIKAGSLPADITGDKILPHFITTQVPPGAAGLLVAAVFAAAMSSIDSGLHALATCMTVDFYERFFKPNRSDRHYLKVAQLLIVIWGLFSVAAAFYVASAEINLLPYLIKYVAFFLGPVLGLFLMGILFPRINANGAFFGTLAAGVILGINYSAGGYNFGIWQTAIAAPLAVIIGYGISLLGKTPSPASLRGLTLIHGQTEDDSPRE
ncbi:sodium:solute symporter [filamentous cyanobacterium LEGE 11480]|uniref:Sodium:solute symporter n=1 Tax=Romeriopsis navalis LEGE 11480 TaxID=2777977 RepID=A0A928VN70_9CYAN|nr:sodium:solute symporter [Romeriopsis navalis]MBE9030773.1 sodium:solute symporter [Romeriopsis navalis LEGE 11480]